MAKTNGAPSKKTECPITRKHFKEMAKALPIQIGNTTLVGEVKEFSTSSFGWGSNEKVVLMIDGIPVKCQLSLNITVVGSKEAR